MSQFQFINDIRLKIAVSKFIELLISGKTLEAIDEFYDDQIIQYENTQEPIIGKLKLRAMEVSNLEKVTSFSTEVNDLVIDEHKGLVLGEMIIEFEDTKGIKNRITEAFIQHWDNGKIIKQKFYYDGVEKIS